MDYRGYCIQEELSGVNVYSSYENWLAGEEPLHQAGSLREAQAWVDEVGLRYPYEEQRKTFTPQELADIARIIYEATAAKTATVFTPAGPLYTRWWDLPPGQREQAVEGLRQRIEREGLLGYLERKRPAAGDELTDSIVRRLQEEGYLP